MEKAYTQNFIHREGSFEFDATRDRKSMDILRDKLLLLCCAAESMLYAYSQDS